MFRTRMPNTGAKHIFLVTDNDDPAKGQPKQLEAALNGRRDLLDLGYDLDPFFVPPTKGDGFDLDKFYAVSRIERRLTGSKQADEAYATRRRSLPAALTTTTRPTRRGCIQACHQPYTRCTSQ